MAQLKLNRTPAQRAADIFDADLYRLVTEAMRHAHDLKSNPEHKRAWINIEAELRSIRPRVREMMHAQDLAGTE